MKIKFQQLNYFLFGILAFGMISCVSKRSLTEFSPDGSVPGKKLEEVRSGNLDFEWYYTKGEATIQYENTNLTANADFRMKKDSAILVVLKMMGLEIGRAFITPDSFFLVNRMEGNYMAEPLEAIARLYKVPFTFDELQQIIAGNHLTEGMIGQQVMEKEGKFTLEAAGERWKGTFVLDDKKVKNVKYELITGESIEAEFNDYFPVDKHKQSPLKRAYYYPSSQNPEYILELRLDLVELNKTKTMKFEIPSKYSRI